MSDLKADWTGLACALLLACVPTSAGAEGTLPRLDSFPVRAGADAAEVMKMKWSDFDLPTPVPGGLHVGRAEIAGLKGNVTVHGSVSHPGKRVSVWTVRRDGAPCSELFPKLAKSLVEAFGPAETTTSGRWPDGFMAWTGEISVMATCSETPGRPRRIVHIDVSRFHPDLKRLKAMSWEELVGRPEAGGVWSIP